MTFTELKALVRGDVLEPADAQYTIEIAAYNTSIRHTPDVVVTAANAGDIVSAVNFAREHNMQLSVQSTGHTDAVVTSGVMISTRRLQTVHVNPISRTAILGAGVRWGAVIAECGKYGLAPIAGSSATVGVIGYLMGGGLGPLARSHGFSSDYVTGFTVVTGTSEVVIADYNTNAELFWAMRGGKFGFGIASEVRIRLVPLRTLYAGSLMFDEAHIDAALRKWIAWTHSAHPLVTSSVLIGHFPDIDSVPEPMRGKRVLVLRFAFPGDNDFATQLAAPLRDFAPTLMDNIGALPAARIATIHNDPTHPGPSWITGLLLDHADDNLATTILERVGRGTESLFCMLELRHIGSATSSDVSEGSAVAGRSATYVVSAAAFDEKLFATKVPAAGAELHVALKPWMAREGTPNFSHIAHSRDQAMQLWPEEMRQRIEDVRSKYDPDGVMTPRYD